MKSRDLREVHDGVEECLDLPAVAAPTRFALTYRFSRPVR